MDMLKIEMLNFSYDEQTPIFSDLNLAFDKRKTAIIGQNGAGKSTLVRLIKQLQKQQSGTIYFLGESVNNMSTKQVAASIGLVAQNPDDQIFKNKVIDEVMFGPLQIGMGAAESREKAMAALEEVGLLDKQELNPYDLNLADRKMIAIASILAMDTKIVIFDEPTIAQDAQGKQRIKNIIQRLESEGKLVITIIHDMDFVAQTFDRTIILYRGNVLFDGHTREAFANIEILKQAGLERPYIADLAYGLGATETILDVPTFLEKMAK